MRIKKPQKQFNALAVFVKKGVKTNDKPTTIFYRNTTLSYF